MRLVVSMVTRNEADRYLDACLSWITPHVDDVFVYDDRSDDDTVELALTHGATVAVREEAVPSFLEAEGTFREAGWKLMADTLGLVSGDYVLALDADEFPLPPEGVKKVAHSAANRHFGSVNVDIPEVFQLDPLSVRKDGHWGKIVGTRITRYREGDQSFRSPAMACGSFPGYSYVCSCWHKPKAPLKIMHFGYAHEDDRQSKYERYTGDGHGHLDAHIQSILGTPKLEPWDKPAPEVWRGSV